MKNTTIPELSQRMAVIQVAPPHPAAIAVEELLSQCGLRTQRRSGPGGQHRNKTSSGVFLQHQPTGIVAEATERRSQADNRSVALTRLRFRLAVDVRTASPIDVDAPQDDAEDQLRQRYQGRANRGQSSRGPSLRLNDTNEAKPAVMALILNDLHAAGGQPSVVAPLWSATTSAVVAIVKSHPPAFSLLNAIRRHHGRGPLK
jgi:hypothetical protein